MNLPLTRTSLSEVNTDTPNKGTKETLELYLANEL